LFGRIFGFINMELNSKITVLREIMENDELGDYVTVHKMLHHDQINGFSVSPPNGSRTLLRLHRALEFIMRFLSDVAASNDDVSCVEIAQQAYAATLASYHPWVLRKGVQLAFRSLPHRAEFINRLRPDVSVSDEQMAVIMHDGMEICQQVYDRVQNMYAAANCLDLP